MLSPEYWKPDASVSACDACRRGFALLLRRHHCRHCGFIFCSDCSQQRLWLRPFPRTRQRQQQQQQQQQQQGGVGGSCGDSQWVSPLANKTLTGGAEESEGSGGGVSLSALDATATARDGESVSSALATVSPNDQEEGGLRRVDSRGLQQRQRQLHVDVGYDLADLINAASSRKQQQQEKQQQRPHQGAVSSAEVPAAVGRGNEDEEEESVEGRRGSQESRGTPLSYSLLFAQEGGVASADLLPASLNGNCEEDTAQTAPPGLQRERARDLSQTHGSFTEDREDRWAKLSERTRRAADTGDMWYYCRVCVCCFAALTETIDRTCGSDTRQDVRRKQRSDSTTRLSDASDETPLTTEMSGSEAMDSPVRLFARRSVPAVRPLSPHPTALFTVEGRDGGGAMAWGLSDASLSHSPTVDASPCAHTTSSPMLSQSAEGLPRATTAVPHGAAAPALSPPSPVSRKGEGGAARRLSGSHVRRERGGMNLSQSISLGWQALRSHVSGGGSTTGSPSSRTNEEGEGEPPPSFPRLSPSQSQHDEEATLGDIGRRASGIFLHGGGGTAGTADPRESSFSWVDRRAPAVSLPSGRTALRQQQQQHSASQWAQQHIPHPRLTVRHVAALQRLAALSRKERRVAVILVDERGCWIPPPSRPGNGSLSGPSCPTDIAPAPARSLADMFLQPFLPVCVAPGGGDAVGRIKDSLTLLSLFEEVELAEAVAPDLHRLSINNPSASRRATPPPSPSVRPARTPIVGAESVPHPFASHSSSAGSASALHRGGFSGAATNLAGAAGGARDRSHLLHGTLSSVSSLQTCVAVLDNAGRPVTLPAPVPGPVRRDLDVRLPVALSGGGAAAAEGGGAGGPRLLLQTYPGAPPAHAAAPALQRKKTPVLSPLRLLPVPPAPSASNANTSSSSASHSRPSSHPSSPPLLSGAGTADATLLEVSAQPSETFLRVPTQLVGLAVEVGFAAPVPAGMAAAASSALRLAAVSGGGAVGGFPSVPAVSAGVAGPATAANRSPATPDVAGAAVGSVSAAASQFVAATAVNKALTALGAQLTTVSVGVDAYLVVVLRQAAETPGSTRSSAGTPATASPTESPRSLSASYASQHSGSNSAGNHRGHHGEGGAGGAVISSLAAEFPFATHHLQTLFRLIAGCGGSVPPVTVLDVCQPADLLGSPGSLAAPQTPSPRTVLAAGGGGGPSTPAGLTEGTSCRMSPFIRSPMHRARHAVLTAMQNLRSGAEAMRVNYVQAFYKSGHLPSSAGVGMEGMNGTGQESVPAAESHATAAAMSASLRSVMETPTAPPEQQPLLQDALELALTSLLRKDYTACDTRS